jgi:hypothetical protein
LIYKRVAARLRTQDWVAVAIELALVVTGVFIGIQVSNWNEQRKGRALEHDSLLRIAQDVRGDVADLDEIIDVSATRMSLLNDVLPKAAGEPLPDGFDSARGRVAIEQVPIYNPNSTYSPGFTLFILTPLDDRRSAYQTMINTGVIADLHDISALRQIQDYYAAVDRETHFEVALEQNRDKFVDAERKVGLSPVKPMTVGQLTAAFASNPELLSTAQNYWLYTNRHLKLTRELQTQARALASSLEKRK